MACWLVVPASIAVAQFPTLPSVPDKDKSKPPAKAPTKDGKKPGAKPDSKQPELWDPGDEIDAPAPLPPTKLPTAPKEGAAADGSLTWSVLVMTFAHEDHAEAARAMRERLAARYPELRDAFVQRVAGGSVLVVGRFKGPDDPAAQAKLKEIKALTVDGQRAFPTAMLTRTATSSEPPGPFDVSKLRERFPTIIPLYSLQVAAWSTFGEKSLSPQDIRAAADRYCKELRAKGYEAWVHHDDSTHTSIVTVGHFDSSAYDSKSTLFSADVQALMKKFPRHLLNGEEVGVPVDPKNPKGKTVPQGCRLVEIPR
ncbi:MAG: hypothetical protein U0572_05210 [Phycisphaerales bacterium]